MGDGTRTALLKRLEDIAKNYDAWWTSPRGRVCQLSTSGLYCHEINGAIPWGDVQIGDLIGMLGDNERGIMKAEMNLSKSAAGFAKRKVVFEVLK